MILQISGHSTAVHVREVNCHSACVQATASKVDLPGQHVRSLVHCDTSWTHARDARKQECAERNNLQQHCWAASATTVTSFRSHDSSSNQRLNQRDALCVCSTHSNHVASFDRSMNGPWMLSSVGPLTCFLSGMNPMISSRNCTLQQSSVNCLHDCILYPLQYV